MPRRIGPTIASATLLCLACGASLASSYAASDLCKDLTSKSAEHRLKVHLFCDYDEDLRPTIGAKAAATNISLAFMPRFITFDDEHNVLELHSWSIMNWTDPHLTWNPDDFDGVENIQVVSDSLWTPDLTVHNANDVGEAESGIPKTKCGLSHEGQVMCVPAVKYSAHCQPDYTDYPFDLHLCFVELASWAYSDDELYLVMSHKPITTDLSPGQEWDVLYTNAFIITHAFKMNWTLKSRVYTLVFVLARRAEKMHIIFVVPAFVLMALTLCTLWLDCRSDERMIVSCISFICHLMVMQQLFWNIPANGSMAPNLLHFYESSFMIMAFVLILTVLVRQLHGIKSPAPEWLSSTTSLILQSKAGQLLLLSILDPKASAFLEMSADDNDDLVDGGNDRPKSESNTNTWNYVALLISWVAFIVISLVYLVILPMYLPYKPFYDPDYYKH